MNPKTHAFVAFLLLFTALPLFAGKKAKNHEKHALDEKALAVLSRFAEVSGLRNVRLPTAIITRGSCNIAGMNISGTFISIQFMRKDRVSLSRNEYTFPMGKTIEGFDGKNAWVYSLLMGGVMPLPDEMVRLNNALQNSDIFFHPREYIQSIKFLPPQQEQTDVLRIRFIGTDSPVTMTFDQPTGLMRSLEFSANTPLGKVRNRLIFDLSTVTKLQNGIVTACKITVENGMSQIEMQIDPDKIRYYRELPISLFTKPDEASPLLTIKAGKFRLDNVQAEFTDIIDWLKLLGPLPGDYRIPKLTIQADDPQRARTVMAKLPPCAKKTEVLP
ncbi:MAG: hypothetical protein D6820_04875 [Lentisphaerae bacterium]|nr:MAG: hypothetical protein D6820_04875 [Lentisphaerota bacterium]